MMIYDMGSDDTRWTDVMFALFQILFLADLVNCHVVSASSLLALFDNFVEVCLEDNIPQVSWREFLY